MVEKSNFGFKDTGRINISGVNMFLPCSEGDMLMNHHKRVFECRTCDKRFASFQALGGHRSGHKKARLSHGEHGQRQSAAGKPKGHECSICGLEFAIGQALGGHMRRHRAAGQGFGHGLTEKKCRGKRVLLLDLNSPAAGIESLDLRLGLGLGS